MGANIWQPYTCACSAFVSAMGEHELSCSLGFVRVARHGVLNDFIHRALIKAGFPPVKEPQRLLRFDDNRPDVITLISWKGGRSLVWDVMVVDTLTPSHLPASPTRAGAAAGFTADRKNQKIQSPT